MSDTNTQRLTAAEFDAVITLLPRISEQRKLAARLVLVDGLGYAEAAKVADLGARQNVYQIAHRVLLKWEQFSVANKVSQAPQIPRGWRELSVVVPLAAIPEIERVVAQYQNAVCTVAKTTAKNKPGG